VEKYVKKGSLIYIEGKIRTRNYDDQSGAKRYITEIYADRIEFYTAGRRQDATEEGGTPATTQPVQSQGTEEPFVAPPDVVDDLPF
jgi:single-strand DNA-binding protein